MLHIAHIVNPVSVKNTSDLFFAQPVTFESMKCAKEFASNKVKVDLYTSQYPEDRSIIPSGFIVTPDLDRSIFNCQSFQVKRKLPLIKDILDRVYKETDAEYIVYSNVDIALMPYFYTTVGRLLEQGYDTLLINRRTISTKYTDVDDLHLMYMDAGEIHEGIDCFIFKKNNYPEYCLENSFIGSSPIGACLVSNMVSFCKKFLWIEEGHLTFHIGDDKSWLKEEFKDYLSYNFEQFKRILSSLIKNSDTLKTDKVKLAVLEHMMTFCNYRLNNLSLGADENEYDPEISPAEDLRNCLRLYSQQKFDEILVYKVQKKEKKQSAGNRNLLNFLKILKIKK